MCVFVCLLLFSHQVVSDSCDPMGFSPTARVRHDLATKTTIIYIYIYIYIYIHIHIYHFAIHLKLTHFNYS